MQALLELRLQNNLSQQNLATRIGVTQQAIHKFETGESIPKTQTLLKIAEVFDTTIDNLIAHATEQQANKFHSLLYVSNEEKEIIENLRKLNPETKDFIIRSLLLNSNINKNNTTLNHS